MIESNSYAWRSTCRHKIVLDRRYISQTEINTVHTSRYVDDTSLKKIQTSKCKYRLDKCAEAQEHRPSTLPT